MKKSMMALLVLAALTSCKKTETTTVEGTTDSSAMSTNDNMMMNDTVQSSTTTSASSELSAQDKEFAMGAATGGLMEVMMGKLAKTNASDAKVKDMGKMMAEDHGKANEQLTKWASDAKFSLPTALDADKQKKYDDLKMKKGADFDKAYASLMVSDHKEDIAAFKKESSGGTEMNLKSFATSTIPTLEHHLMTAEEVNKMVK